MTDPLGPLLKLKELFAAEAEKRDARLIRFSLSPGETHELDVLMDLGETLLPVPQREQDLLDEMEEAFREDKKQDEADQAIERLKTLENKLQDDGGFL